MTMFAEAQDGVRLAFEIVGRGEPVLLVHGFASDRVQNWRGPGWYGTLEEAGYQVVAMDCRGHGESDKPYDPVRYDHRTMANDVLAVMEAAGLGPVHLMGYSMGGHIGIHVLLEHPDSVAKFIVGGVGASYLRPDNGSRAAIADALLEPDKSKLNPTQRGFREFAEQQGKDIRALAACMRGDRMLFAADALSQSTRPVLVVCGENDAMTGRPEPLAAAFSDGQVVVVPRRDHMTAVGDKVYKKAVLEFLRA